MSIFPFAGLISCFSSYYLYRKLIVDEKAQVRALLNLSLSSIQISSKDKCQ